MPAQAAVNGSPASALVGTVRLGAAAAVAVSVAVGVGVDAGRSWPTTGAARPAPTSAVTARATPTTRRAPATYCAPTTYCARNAGEPPGSGTGPPGVPPPGRCTIAGPVGSRRARRLGVDWGWVALQAAAAGAGAGKYAERPRRGRRRLGTIATGGAVDPTVLSAVSVDPS